MAERSWPEPTRESSGLHAIFHAGDDLADLEAEAVGFGDGLDAGVAEAGAEEGGELALAVEALVVDFGDDDVFVFGEHFLQTVRHGVHVAHGDAAGFAALGAEAVGGFSDAAGGAAPADEKDFAVGVAMDLRDFDFLGEAFEFLAAAGG